MKVRVTIREEIKEGTGPTSIKIPIKEQETIDTLLIKLSRRNPELVESILDPRTGNIKEEFNVHLNGRPIRKIKGLHTRLKDKDEITIQVSKN
ncbi:hypothetical protein AKJ39_02550 [candidate division MSBL1 archaeon SCGC-AAA259J03]|uniref:Ubiquitin-like domain-containing protein n=1 Tax=candidate division MSBL1 archaeon SCGC-AAA259J03 TaxID=1698269 RepID=A0A656YW30_9EURY|nr:hypothetical protein AKJ39_02550 [candidate division MSBL1 archaeon SCGC-AAA259J03]